MASAARSEPIWKIIRKWIIFCRMFVGEPLMFRSSIGVRARGSERWADASPVRATHTSAEAQFLQARTALFECRVSCRISFAQNKSKCGCLDKLFLRFRSNKMTMMSIYQFPCAVVGNFHRGFVTAKVVSAASDDRLSDTSAVRGCWRNKWGMKQTLTGSQFVSFRQ